MSKELRFDGKVAIVTGAGGGLGRSHALLLASRGAKVVVNDLGGGMHGGGQSSAAADRVVAEIKEAGGEAVANYDSVEDGEKIVQTALDAFGGVDIVINNAGILRDVTFHKMTQSDWDLVYRVHVLGAFRVTHAAWPHMRDQGYGRIINTASAAGIYGNFGQANYSMAKLGLVGFTNTLALEGQKRNIHVNTIAPIAGSRMTETVLPKEVVDALQPEYVSPLVAWLCHEECEANGGLFEVGGGFYAGLRWERAEGRTWRLGRAVSPEDIAGSWDQISGFDKATHPATVMESMQPIMANLEDGPSKGGNKFIDVDLALGHQFKPMTNRYDEKDLALYALGVGASASDATQDAGLRYVYEMYGGGMRALPTFGVIPALNAYMDLAKAGEQAPGLNYGFERILHGEQYTEVLRPLPTTAKLTHKARVKDIFDKGKGALVIVEVKSYDEDGQELIRNEITTFVRGAGGWGGDRGSSVEVNVPPERAPDKVVEQTIPENQALLYRLSGDWNPLHADPDFARNFGFDKPILHGLCTFGYSGRHVIDAFAPEGDPRYFKSIKVRFADSVFPGDTLVTEMWQESATRVVFRTRVKDREATVLTHAAIEFYEEIPKPAAKKPAAASTPAAAAPAVPTGADVMAAVGQFLQANPEVADRIKVTYLLKLKGPDSDWTLDLSAAPGSVTQGAGKSPQCTLEMSDEDMVAMATGKADAMKLFTTGKLKISGDLMASQKLGFLSKLDPASIQAAADARTGSGGGGAAAAPAAAADEVTPESITSWDIFMGIRDHVRRHPELAQKVGKVYLFELSDPASAWTMDLKDGNVAQGSVGTIDCTLKLTDEDFMKMVSGEVDPMKLFTTGKLKISGDLMASQKLNFLQKLDRGEMTEAIKKARAEHGGPAQAAEAAAPAAAAAAPAIFEALTARLADNPGLASEVEATINFTITEPDGAWTVTLKGDQAAVAQGTSDGADTTITLSDEDFAALVKGEAELRRMFQNGRARIDGDINPAQRLGFLKSLI